MYQILSNIKSIKDNLDNMYRQDLFKAADACKRVGDILASNTAKEIVADFILKKPGSRTRAEQMISDLAPIMSAAREFNVNLKIAGYEKAFRESVGDKSADELMDLLSKGHDLVNEIGNILTDEVCIAGFHLPRPASGMYHNYE